MTREPVLITAALVACIALGVAFGLPVSPTQVGAIVAAAQAILALFTRQLVTPVGSTAPAHVPAAAAPTVVVTDSPVKAPESPVEASETVTPTPDKGTADTAAVPAPSFAV